ncbi:exodeoxyribonuclease III [Ferrovibrio sp.]|uniref:exodeoxyribonuclease III n=1 Tax=Ferrovibrio sp. TaxID=1917215 RepID=UPI0025BE02C9|nr:exodeoxyribonuclease III [Ferrovibrio sp.]
MAAKKPKTETDFPKRALTLATWNINSVRARQDLMHGFLQQYAPDILCLQETKVRDSEFPHDLFVQHGYAHRLIQGQPGYNGVAIFARFPIELAEARKLVGRDDKRHIAARLPDGTVIHNYYVPAGGDIPDPKKNDKFQHKLDVLAEMTAWSKGLGRKGKRHVLVGDLNIAPLESDVWSHKQLLDVVSHTPVETEGLLALQKTHGWLDAMRHFVGPSEKLYSWWSYRSPDWEKADKGRRLDHVWLSPDLAPALKGCQVVKAMRGKEKASDHAPVLATLDLAATGG